MTEKNIDSKINNAQNVEYKQSSEHKHIFVEKGNHLVCSCGKQKLNLLRSNLEGVSIGTKSNGKPYMV